jgi:hypothetical protein
MHHGQREGLPRHRAPAARAGGSPPDDFLLDQVDLSPPTLVQVIREQAARTRRPPLTPRDLATLLGRAVGNLPLGGLGAACRAPSC